MSDAASTSGPNPAPDPDKTPAIHDIGGLSRFRCSAVERDEAPPDAFGKRVDALRQVLAAKKLMTVDEMRRCIESIPEDEYFALTYYERWMTSFCTLMVEKGVIAAEDVA
jgi:nitrile hydratase